MSGGTIFAGSAIKLLKNQLKFQNNTAIINGAIDPRVVATEAEPGSLYMSIGAAGYSIPDTFADLAGGALPAGAQVFDTVQIGSYIYAGFNTVTTSVGGVSISGIARWNGVAWSVVGSGVGGTSHDVMALAAIGTDLYVGGTFTTMGIYPAARIAKFDTLTSTWTALPGLNGSVADMCAIGTDLYIGGNFTYVGGVLSNSVAKLDTLTNTWTALASGVSGVVQAMTIIGSDLYIGGNFTSASGVAQTTHIAKWDGSNWNSVGGGLDSQVYSMVANSTDLYVGGLFSATVVGGITLNCVGKWNGSSWSALGTGVGPGGSIVFALGFLGTNLYAGGTFTTAGGNPASMIAKWNGATWSAMGTGADDRVTSANPHGGSMYFGGKFSTLNGVTVNRISKLTEATYVAAVPVALYQKMDTGTTTNWFKLDIPEIRVDFFDPVAVSLPTGVAVTIDGTIGQDGDTVLFANLGAVYMLSGVGSAIAWSLISQFDGLAGTSVRFIKGSIYSQQLAYYDGSDFFINDKVRFFDGANGSNFWEMSSIKTASLANNTSSIEIFAVNKVGTENIAVDYSLVRGSVKRVGQLLITHDGTNVAINDASADLGDTGVIFTSDISSGNLRLLADTDNSGLSTIMKFYTRRWSDSPGGPTGIPNYTSALGSSSVVAAGSTGDVQFKGVTGDLAGESSFNWATSTKVLSLGSIKRSVLLTAPTLIDNTVSPTALFSYALSGQRFSALDYSLELANGSETQIGRLMIVHNGTSANISDESIATYGGPSGLGVIFSVAIVGLNVQVYYTATSMGGQNRIMKYAFRYWN